MLLVNIPSAYSCSCAAVSVPTAQNWSTAVFSGTVTKIDRPAGILWQSSADPMQVTFAVSESWKGSAYEVLTVETAQSEASCGYSFVGGETYLVYARSGGKQTLRTELCSRTALLAAAEEDLQILGTSTTSLQMNPDTSLPQYNMLIAIAIFVGVSGLFVGSIFFLRKRKY